MRTRAEIKLSVWTKAVVQLFLSGYRYQLQYQADDKRLRGTLLWADDQTGHAIVLPGDG